MPGAAGRVYRYNYLLTFQVGTILDNGLAYSIIYRVCLAFITSIFLLLLQTGKGKNQMYKKIHVDTSHRYRTLKNGNIDLRYWIANRTEENIAKDKLLPLHKQYIADCVNPETYTILCTARS